MYELLTHHYVEDLDATFRFDYSPEFIEWCVPFRNDRLNLCLITAILADGSWCCRALKPPGYFPDWHVGIRVAETGKLVAFIAGIPMELRVRNAYVSPP